MATDPLFRMTVRDAYFFADRGTVALGRIESGQVHVGDQIQITRQNAEGSLTRAVSGLEGLRKGLAAAATGDVVQVVLKGLPKNYLQPGDVLESGLRTAQGQAAPASQPPGADTPTPAWGVPGAARAVPVPAEFEPVTSLGPATAVYGRDSGVLFPGSGAPKALVFYQDGFAYLTGAKDLHLWRWDEIAVIQTKVRYSGQKVVNESHEYTLVKASGEKFVLGDVLKEVEDIAGPIKQMAFELLRPPLVEQYAAGQALTFGPITIHRETGLQTGGKHYAWADIQDIKVDRGRFTVTLRDGKHFDVDVATVPNIELLCDLIGLKLEPTSLINH